MPKTKFQGAVFGLLMSYIMAFGMEVYNTAINMGFLTSSGSFSSMTNMVFWNAFKETLYMGAIVFVLSSADTLDFRLDFQKKQKEIKENRAERKTADAVFSLNTIRDHCGVIGSGAFSAPY